MLLQICMKLRISCLVVGVPSVDTIHGDQMEPGRPCPGDSSDRATGNGWATVNLQRYSDQDGRASATSCIPLGGRRVPYTMPACCPGKRLERREGWAQMPVLLQKEDLSR